MTHFAILGLLNGHLKICSLKSLNGSFFAFLQNLFLLSSFPFAPARIFIFLRTRPWGGVGVGLAGAALGRVRRAAVALVVTTVPRKAVGNI